MTENNATYKVLAVDDEAGILSALTRQLRRTAYELTTAGSGAEALALMEQQKFQIVISDMRMPEMNGAEFLSAVKSSYPETVRILLTGYADMESTIRAINEGGIFSYIAKPWEREELIGLLDRAAAHYQMRRNKQVQLVKISRKAQALELATKDLETRLAKSQQEVEQTSAFVDMARKEVEEAYDTAIEVFANLIDLKIPGETGINREVAQIAQYLGVMSGLSPVDQRNLRLAGMLYNVGKIGLPSAVILKPYSELEGQERVLFHRYPRMGESVLLALRPLASVTPLIALHRECLDGSGFPMGISQIGLPLPARILAVAVAFREVVKGRRDGRERTEAEGIQWLREHGHKYDAEIVNLLAQLIADQADAEQGERRQAVAAYALQPGMTLARDLYSTAGVLLLSRGHRLDGLLISKLISMESQVADEIMILDERDSPTVEQRAQQA